EAAASGLFKIRYRLGGWIQFETGVERGDFGGGLLGGMLEAVGAAVVGGEARVPLEDEVALRGEPPWERLRMREDGIIAGVVVYLGEGRRRGENRAEQTGGGCRRYPDQRGQHADVSYRTAG